MTIDATRLRTLLAAATPGPVTVRTVNVMGSPERIVQGANGVYIASHDGDADGAEADAELHAALRNAAPALVAALAERDALRASLRALVDGMKTWASDEDGVHYGAWDAFARAHELLGLPKPDPKDSA